ADEHAVGMLGYAREFARLAAGEERLDGTAPADENARVIAARALPLVVAPGGPAREPLVAPGGAPVVRTSGAPRCRLHLGPGHDLPELGADVMALRAGLGGAFPEAFWLEAYAAQLLLDLRALDPPRARAALWPGALARMTDHGDLEVLRELERMLLAEVELESCSLVAGAQVAAFAALGAHPSAAERLARDYALALEGLARERGWPVSAR
ncbi:MAG TPA: hypothetical protein VNO33_08410, partial [Kofleriaceae bacterium]|nr:hypothetical protein [Kofleriaceae bacterium]